MLLALLSKEGLFAVAVVAIALFQTYSNTGRADAAQLKAIAEQLTAHNKAMEDAELARQTDEATRRANDRVQRALLRGICYGTSSDIPQARALCDVDSGR